MKNKQNTILNTEYKMILGLLYNSCLRIVETVKASLKTMDSEQEKSTTNKIIAKRNK